MIESCAECPQYMVKEIEPGLAAFCLYCGEGLLLDNPICRHYKEGQVPEEPVFSPKWGCGVICPSPSAAAAPHGTMAGSGDSLSLEEDETFDLDASQSLDRNSSNHQNRCGIPSPREGLPKEARHLVKIINVLGYLHNFSGYIGSRARIVMEILAGPDTGKTVVDNVSLPHPEESKGMQQRRVRIGHRLGLIPWGTRESIQVNWKLLEAVVCWVDVAYKSIGGRKVLTVDNYELQ